MSALTPRQIVQELDKHIIGQDAAKRAVAIALRNRWRRMQVDEPLRQEIPQPRENISDGGVQGNLYNGFIHAFRIDESGVDWQGASIAMQALRDSLAFPRKPYTGEPSALSAANRQPREGIQTSFTCSRLSRQARQ